MRLRKKAWIKDAIMELKDEYVILENIDSHKGSWSRFFPGKKIALEIGCGKGAFINGMAELNKDKAYIGVETQQDVAYYAAKKAKEAGNGNALIICGNAAYLEDWFAPGEIKEIYLNFSDPWPKARHERRRLTHRSFLEIYKNLLGAGGHLRFKTDNRALFDFSIEEFKACGLEIIALSYDLHHSEHPNPVMTEYEIKFSALGNPICFCEAVF